MASRRDEAGVGVGVGGWAAARDVRVDVGSEGEAWRISRAVASYSSMCQLAERDSGAVRDRWVRARDETRRGGSSSGRGSGRVPALLTALWQEDGYGDMYYCTSTVL